MKIDILTLFPEMFCGPFDESMVKRAQEKNLVKINIHNLRKWTKDRHKTVDDRPYGGGIGMILMVEPIYKALNELKSEIRNPKSETSLKSKTQNSKLKQKAILLTPQGKTFNQKRARQLSRLDHLILICGHYEGIDERVRKHLVDEEISIGDYVLTGGEIPALVIVDTITRLLPGVLEKEAIQNESFSSYTLDPKPYTLLDFPQYTRPENYQGWKVPEILLSGNHEKISKWRQNQSLKRTQSRRPDLLNQAPNSTS